MTAADEPTPTTTPGTGSAPQPPPAPTLPEVEQIDAEDLIADQPTPEEIVEAAEPAEAILRGEPSVQELIGHAADEPGADEPDGTS